MLQEIIATLSSTCNGHLITVFNTLRLLQMGALIGPMFISASLWSSLVGVCSSWGSTSAITTAVYPLLTLDGAVLTKVFGTLSFCA